MIEKSNEKYNLSFVQEYQRKIFKKHTKEITVKKYSKNSQKSSNGSSNSCGSSSKSSNNNHGGPSPSNDLEKRTKQFKIKILKFNKIDKESHRKLQRIRLEQGLEVFFHQE